VSEPAPTLALRGLGKTFPPAVQALAGASLELRAGEVHALIGENGAGKSTLSRIVAGIEQPSAGDMLLRGRGYAPASRRSAEESGVRMVMQELSLVPTLTVAENIYLERLPRRYGLIDRTRLRCEASALLADLGLDAIHPATPVGALGIGQQQMVEIARGLSAKCEVLILDEPTAALTAVETDSLFAQIARLTASGVAILYISHRLEEIVRIAQRITVLRDGAVVASQPSGQVTIPEMVRMMVGRAVPTTGLRSTKATEAVALRVQNLTTRSGARNVSFDLRRGEILGLAGLMGSGRTETVRAIFGADPIVSGSIEIDGRPARIRSPHDAVRAGMALVTEDRKAQGLLLPASIRHNITLASMRAFRAPGGFISRNREQERAEAMSRQLNVRASSIEQPASQLSGGNQQKVVIAKWLLRDPQILIFDEPTRGIDMGARFEIYQLLVSLAERGKAILVVSSELPELLLLCNRIAVLSRGKLARIFDDAEFDQDAIMRAALSEFAASTRATS
jgi:ribose transport system ATP-binding protein